MSDRLSRRLRGPIRLGLLALAALLVSALLLPSRPAVVSALTGEPLTGVSLRHPPGYLALAPVLGVWDWLTARTVDEHVGVFLLLGLAYLTWRLARPRRRGGPGRRVLVEAGAALAFFVGVLAFYAYGAVGPRPMAALQVEDPEVVVVDLHSHTEASHDGRPGFDAEANRAWHAGAGFHLAWITDHDHIAPAVEAMGRNPTRAGDGVSILAGREVVYAEQHVVALGLWDPRHGAADPACGRWPLLIQTLPNDLSRVHTGGCTPAGAGVHAIELVDGDPRGFGQAEAERDRLLAIADSLDLTLVSASNLHGWGRTAISWNLVRVPGWRGLAPEEVGRRVEAAVRAGFVEVVTVRPPRTGPAGPVEAALAPAARLADFAATRSRGERVAWILWGTAAWLIVAGATGRRRAAVVGAPSGSSRR